MQGLVIAEYIWIGGKGSTRDLRSKSRTLVGPILGVQSIPCWSYDGSSCGQTTVERSDVILKPVALFQDPFRGAPHVLVLCESIQTNDMPVQSNTRYYAAKIAELVQPKDIWIGFEQEYMIYKQGRPLGWPAEGLPELGQNYCGAGGHITGRVIADEHYRLCLEAGLEIYGVNSEVLPGQFEFQTGPSSPIVAADHLVVARYILQRVAERFEVSISFDPKPFDSLPGSGLHTNYSDVDLRALDNNALEAVIKNLALAHPATLQAYGDNSKRLSGLHETSRSECFTHGRSDRTASVRIPPQGGYIEDRRPAADACPYLVLSALVDAIYLQSSYIQQ